MDNTDTKQVDFADVIETKIDTHIDMILDKPSLDYSDYLTLINEIARQAQKLREAKWESEKGQRNEIMMNTLKNLIES